MECESSVQKRLFVAPSILLVRLLGQTSKKSKYEICPYRYTPFYTRISRLKPGSQYDARLSSPSFRHSVSFRRAVHNVASLCAFLNFDPRYSGRTMGQKRLACVDADEARKP